MGEESVPSLRACRLLLYFTPGIVSIQTFSIKHQIFSINFREGCARALP